MAGKRSNGEKGRRVLRDDAALRSFFADLGDFVPEEGAHTGTKPDLWRTAAYMVEQAKLDDLFKSWRAEDRGDKREGPTPWLSEAQIIALFLVLTLKCRPPLFTEMAALLYNTEADLLAILGIVRPGPEASQKNMYDRAYNSYRRLVALMNPEPESLYRQMTKEEYATKVAEREVEDCDKRWQRSVRFTAALFYGCWMLLPREARRKTTVDVVIDSTRIQSPSRPVGKTSKFVSSDPTCAWYTRQGNHDAEDPANKKGKTKVEADTRAKRMFVRHHDIIEWAREFHLLALCIPGLPHIPLAAALDNPGKNIAENTLLVVDALLEQGFKIDHFVCDMAYLPNTKMQELALPLRARGIAGVFGYPRETTSLGLQATHGGAILVEGTWYCASMPQNLIDASINYFLKRDGDPEQIDTAEYEKLLDQRVRYQFKTKQQPDADGFARLQCPSVGPYATAKCDYREMVPADATGRTKIPTINLIVPKPRVCQQQTVTFPPEVDGKFGQRYPYQSPQWRHYYTLGRQTIESINRTNKRGYFAPINDPDWRPRRGWLNALIAGVAMILANNVRKIIRWAWERMDLANGYQKPKPRKRRRELTKGYTQPLPLGPPLEDAA